MKTWLALLLMCILCVSGTRCVADNEASQVPSREIKHEAESTADPNPADARVALQPRRGRGPMGRGRGRDAAFEEDHKVFFFLLENRAKITRKVKLLKDGIETVTESDDPKVAAKIREHVAAMYVRLEKGRPIHMRDPLFRAVFQNAEKVKMKTEKTDKGIRVIETSDDPYVAKLIQSHAKVVSLFIKNGHSELPKNHEVPKKP